MKWHDVMSMASTWLVWITVVLGRPAWSEETEKPRSTPIAPTHELELVEKALALMDGAEEIVFVVRPLYSDGHYYANFGGWSDNPNRFLHPPDGSQLCKLNLRTKKVTILLDDAKGNIRDPRVHYDGGKILFAYRKSGTKHYNLYEINTDGSELKQLTFGEWDDMDPAYLPDGGIVFVSSRGKRFIPCYNSEAAILYRMDADGSNMLCLSANNVRDDRPAVLPDGRIIYTRWEYVDAAIASYRDLWVMNPDGTGQMVLFGGTVRPPDLVFSECDALPIPGAPGKVVSVYTAPSGNRENAGKVMIVDLKAGPDEPSAVRQISPKRNLRYHHFWPTNMPWYGGGRVGFRDPYPLSEDCFLVAEDKKLLVLDGNGNLQEFFQAKKMVHDPRVIRPRPREPVIRPRIDRRKTTGQFILADVYHGRNMEMAGIKPGTIKELLILEDLPKPISYYSLPGTISMDGTHTLRRVLGTVPVEPDGSASFKAPALRGLYFVALDEKGLAVKRMQSYTMVMPGETQGCVGCHEARTSTAGSVGRATLLALKRPPSQIEPVLGVPEVFDYPRDIQPIWDKHCVVCHNAEEPSGRVVLTGDRNEWFTQSYYSLFAYKQIRDMFGRYNTEFRDHRPYGFGTGASPLMQKIDGSHHNATLTKQEYDTVRLWVEASAYFTGTYAVYNHPENAVAGVLMNNARVEIGKPLDRIIYDRCLWCHDSEASIGRRVRKGRVNLPKHCWNLYNLSHPEKSMILLAPLAKEAGGYGWCKDEYGQSVVFRDTKDHHYQAILRAIQAAKERQEKLGRYDMPGWRPNEHYVRWMKRFGVLPESFDLSNDPIDVYETDRTYWRSLWYRPPAATATVEKLVAPSAQVEQLAGGFGFTEGPASNAQGDLYFTDIPNNRIHKWSVNGRLTTFRDNTGGANGLFFYHGGNLLSCEGIGRQVTSISPDGKVTVLADGYQGKKLNSPNDLWVDPKGGMYFTDPRYGRMSLDADGNVHWTNPQHDDQGKLEQDGFHVYYLPPAQKEHVSLVRVAADVLMPNGVVGTADGKRLYVADTGAGKTYVYRIHNDGSLADRRVFAPIGADGMTVDERGNVYLARNVVHVYSPEGEKITTIDVPEAPSNVCFGGTDRQTLFITARKGLYAIRMNVRGQ